MSHSSFEHPINILLTPDQVAERYHVKRITIERWNKAGSLPDPVRLNGTTPRWRLVDLQDHEAKLSAQNKGEG